MTDSLASIFRIAGSALEAQSTRLRVVSENIANVRSTGATPDADPYSRKTISFTSEIDRATNATLLKVAGVGRDEAPFRLEYEPTNPAADARGYVKMPNVNIHIEMADLREANRSYQANLQSVRSAREMFMLTVDLLKG